MPETTIEPEDQALKDTFRHALRSIAVTVHLVTTSDESQRRHGITATSVASVSMSPPSLLACINTASTVFGPIDRHGSFCVNVLANEHEQLSARFSSPDEYEARFKFGEWKQHAGLPYLADAQAAIFCNVARKIVHGSHAIFIGNVEHVIVPRCIKQPLIYFNRKYLSHENTAGVS